MIHSESLASSHKHAAIMLWTRGCQFTVAICCVVLIVVCVPLYLASQNPPIQAAPERINPNTAPVASLVRLPGIGKARALDIVHFRKSSDSQELAFRTTQDMERIKGIGPKTVEKLTPWLIFE